MVVSNNNLSFYLVYELLYIEQCSMKYTHMSMELLPYYICDPLLEPHIQRKLHLEGTD
jgi:hypothetical protein